MKIKLKDIELADCRINETKIDLDARSVIIISSKGYYIPQQKMIEKIEILITQWSEFIIRKYISHESGKGEEVILRSYDDMETFTLIQEIVFRDDIISFNGWSKESGAWIMYEFVEPQVEVEGLM